MIPGIDPRMMKQAMRRMGIQQQDIDATEVIIKMPDKEIVITEPQVAKINMMGQQTFQISGSIHERERSSEVEISDDDIKTVMEQAKTSRDKAASALKEANGDIAEAILKLQG